MDGRGSSSISITGKRLEVLFFPEDGSDMLL
jgi:hypothetical protein